MTWFASSSPHSAGGLPRDYAAPSAFEPDALIREARRQKCIPVADVPRVCVLDPDGDIVRHLSSSGRTRLVPQWPCYHSRMVEADLNGRSVGIVDCAVGAPYAVLVAEQMFALGCELLLSITSSGQVAPLGPTPYFVLIDRALRDEGTSHHYTPPAEFAEADATLVRTAEHALAAGFRIHRGATWTTDAPFRETSAAIAAARAKGILAVEMEAAALYAFAQSRGVRVLCFAHVTNCMGQSALDFEKGEAQGVTEALRILSVVAAALAPV
jgi:uridine phosphorylase